MSVKLVELVLKGQTYTIPYDTTIKKNRKELDAPSQTSWNEPDHKYAMQVKVHDMAGNLTTIDKNNSSFGTKMLLRVLEKNPPVITITKPSSGAYLGSNAVAIEFTVTDAESGVNPDSINLKVDSQAAVAAGITKTAITNGYKCTYTATISDGTHTIKVNASDNDGNAAVEKQSAFTVDTVPPELNIASPAAALITNKSTLNVTGSTNELCTITMVLNNVNQGAVTLNADKTFTKNLTWTKGANILDITATDRAGKTTTVRREITYDPVAPVVLSIDISKNPVNAGEKFVVTIEATDE